MQAITLEVILRTVIGVSDERRLERLRVLLRRLTRVGIAEMWLVWAYPQLLDSRAVRLSTLRVLPEVDRLLYEEIAAHRAARAGSHREDVLALLLEARDEHGEGLSDEELRDHLLTLLVAGHETTTTALAWCFERLLRHPAALARLEQEIGRGGGGVPGGGAQRDAAGEAGDRRGVAQALGAGGGRGPAVAGGSHRDALDRARAGLRGVPGCQAFRPERFLEGSAPPYTFIPFGGGPRRCIGASFAMMEMRAIVRTVSNGCGCAPPARRTSG